MSASIVIVNFTGFETGTADEASLVSAAGLSYDTVTVRTGTYSLKIDYNGVAVRQYILAKHDTTNGVKTADMAVQTVYVTCYVYISSAPTLNPESLIVVRNTEATPRIKGDIRLTTTRTLNFYDNNGGTLRASGSTVLSTGKWYRIDLKVGSESSDVLNNGAYELKIDGVSEFSGTNGDTNTTNVKDVVLGQNSIHNAAAHVVYFDDFSVSSSAFVGDSKVTMPTVSGNGTFTAWSGTYASVDETPPNGDTDYINTGTSPNRESVASTSLSTYGMSATSIFHAVKALMICRKVSGTTALRLFQCITSTTQDTTVDLNVTTSYVLYGTLQNLDFTTSVDWVYAGANACEPGVWQNGSVAVRCTYLRKMILWTPVTARRILYAPHAGI